MKQINKTGIHAMPKKLSGTLPFALMVSLSLFFGCKKSETDSYDRLSPSGKSTASTSSGNLWYDKYVAWESANGSYYLQTSNSASLAWGESHYMRSYIKLYELTKSTAWLDKFVTHADIMLTRTTDLGSDGYLDWSTSDYNGSTTALHPYLVHDGMIGLPIAEFIRLVHQNSTALSAYTAKATTYRTFIENEIVPKWSNASSYMGNCWIQGSNSDGYFKEPATFDSLPSGVFNPLPYNMMAPFAQMLWAMYDVNGNTGYKDKADRISKHFKDGLMSNTTTAYKWYYVVGQPTNTIEDTSHGNLEMEMAIEAFNRGVTFLGSQASRLSNTFTDFMWNQSLTTPRVRDRVDGTGTTYQDSRSIYGYMPLTALNSTVWTITAEQYRSTNATHASEAHTLARIMEWDPVKVHNQGFEYKFFNDDTLPARWIRGGGTSSNIRLYTADKFSGKNCAAITSASGDGTWQMLYQDWKQWKPNTTYEITFNVKTIGTAGARVFMMNTTAGTVVGTIHDYDSAAWSTQSFTFTTPTSGPNLRLYLENHDLSTDGTALFDNVVIKQSGEAW